MGSYSRSLSGCRSQHSTTVPQIPRGMIHTCLPAAPGAMLHQLDKEAGQVVGVQHPCQCTQGQAGDTAEREKRHSQINARIYIYKCSLRQLGEAGKKQ